MIIFVLNIFLTIITLIFKSIYYIFRLFCNIITYIFHSKSLRLPFILILITLIFNINLKYIASIYFLSLVHTLALKLDIYALAKNNLNIFNKKLISKFHYKQKLKNINPEFILLNDLYLNSECNSEESDFDIYSFSTNNILITKYGVFNIKLAPNANLDYSSFHFNDKSFKTDKEYIFNNSILRETLPL